MISIKDLFPFYLQYVSELQRLSKMFIQTLTACRIRYRGEVKFDRTTTQQEEQPPYS